LLNPISPICHHRYRGGADHSGFCSELSWDDQDLFGIGVDGPSGHCGSEPPKQGLTDLRDSAAEDDNAGVQETD
jgi:hypothetical protein